ncbi:MAG: TonB-dependent receptor [Mariprofundaceae bacterium]
MFLFRCVLYFVGTLFLTTNIIAAELHSDDDDAAMSNLLKILEVETEIATKTKMNADYVPGMVTVLHGDELQRQGYSSVWDALALVPGMHLQISQEGQRQVITRGVGGAINSPELKMLINGIPAHSNLFGLGQMFYIPIQQVERIEIIRGPGSAIHGEYAFAGVIDVITRKDSSQAHVQYGSFNTLNANALLATTAPNGLHLSLNAAHHQTDGANPLSGKDVLYSSGQGAVSNAPGFSNEQETTDSILFTVENDTWNAYARYLATKHGNYFGIAHALEPSAAPQSKSSEIQLGIQKTWEFSDHYQFKLSADYLRSIWDGRYSIFPAGYSPSPPFAPAFTFDVIAENYFKEDKYTFGAELLSQPIDQHEVVVGVNYWFANPLDVWTLNNNGFSSAHQVFRGAKNWMSQGKLARNMLGIYAQDNFSISDQLTMIIGVRYDRFNDVGDTINPRLALLYQLNEYNLIKLQFSQAFRPPTMYELYFRSDHAKGNPALKPENIQSYELGAIHRSDDLVLRGTLFYSQLKNLIFQNAASSYGNKQGKTKSYGIEMEAEVLFSKQWKMTSNLSYIATKDGDTGRQLEGSANYLANANLSYQPINHYVVQLIGHHVGARHRAKIDTRPKLSGYTVLDTSFTSTALPRGLSFSAGIKNIFNRDVRMPARANSLRPEGNYPRDFPREGRTWWSQISYEF